MATSVIKPVHAGIDVSFSITTSQWTGSSAPYTYTWSDARVTQGCRVEVEYASTTVDTNALYISYEKVSGGGGVTFSAQTKPTANVSVVVHIINAQTGNVQAVTGADVSTSVISGAANVNEALTTLNSNIANKDVTNECTWNNSFTYAFRTVFESGQYYIVQISATSSTFANGAIIVTLPKAAACSQYISGLIVSSNGVPSGVVCVANISRGAKDVMVYISGGALNGYIVLSLLIPKQ